MSRHFAARLLATATFGAGLLAMAPAGAAAQARPALSVSAAALYAPVTHQLLYGVNAEKRVAIASTTKLMTALIVLEHVHRLSTMFAQNDYRSAARIATVTTAA